MTLLSLCLILQSATKLLLKICPPLRVVDDARSKANAHEIEVLRNTGNSDLIEKKFHLYMLHFIVQIISIDRGIKFLISKHLSH